MHLANGFEDRQIEIYAIQRALGMFDVALHQGNLMVVQTLGLGENLARNGKLADLR